ncbi:two pore domain potassium channel family protein [Candidatus Woesearchaeota archaeon]|nr:two pore domain potassium channel family protein [Candidatus Woesearchaeota archaeon]
MSEVIFTEKSPMRLRFLILVVLILLLLVAGTFVYHIVEGWSYIDSLYFSAVSLATRGYGDLHPTKVSSKLFTVFYLFLGVALILYALSSFSH